MGSNLLWLKERLEMLWAGGLQVIEMANMFCEQGPCGWFDKHGRNCQTSESLFFPICA